MQNTFNPILNNPFKEPKKYYATTIEGTLDYEDIKNSRRPYTPEIPPVPIKNKQKEIFDIGDLKYLYEDHIINQLRREISLWRKNNYPNVTRITKELLDFWFVNPERTNKLFFAQREAIETTIWLNEVALKSNVGTSILNKLNEENSKVKLNDFYLSRLAFKMATGTGKTVVMALQILYHFFNRQEYRNDTRFADYFLILTPGVPIKIRLNVLFVDTSTKNKFEARDYYKVRDLVPKQFEQILANLNSRLIITNYHSFEQKTLQGNKKTPFDGKFGSKKSEAKENFEIVLKRITGKFRTGSRVLIINDEAHHCYLPKPNGKSIKEDNIEDENKRAAVWINGLFEIAKKYKVNHIYDLSATPYFLSGSGYQAYTLFPWTVTDFGLIEAIESGLVKIPFLPESDSTHNLDMPMLSNLYEEVKDQLPKKGIRRLKKDKDELKNHPQIPPLIKNAFDQFYSNYEKEYYNYRDMFGNPPVFIVVCNNTSVSSEMFKYIAGYEIENDDSEKVVINGKFPLFDNFNRDTKIPLRKPPTLLIDSDALENSGQINDQFKKVFAPEIEKFKQEYRIIYPGIAIENITDIEILREVVNTVGKSGKLGAHIRCIVSVSMLTEGWDANTVTHIMGLRAFGSQLLCEQVAGRALRRKRYDIVNYDKNGNPIKDETKAVIQKYPPEYAQIIGVPFKFFKSGKAVQPEPKEIKFIQALPERQNDFEITFPNLIGYRIESFDDSISYDFSKISNYELDGTKYPAHTKLGIAFGPEKILLTPEQIRNKRRNELVYFITRNLIKIHFSDEDNNHKFYKFNKLKGVVEYWLDNKITLIGDAFLNMLFYESENKIANHINHGIEAEQRKTDKIIPVFNFYNKFGSTKYVYGNTTREIYPTVKSHVNYVVADTESWEQICAKTLDEIPEVISYVKNAFLDFKIPYIHSEKGNLSYYPDFIAKCKSKNGKTFNLIIEVTGMNKDKEEKKWFVQNRWLTAVNEVKEYYGFDSWDFVEIANDIRDIKNQLINKICSY